MPLNGRLLNALAYLRFESQPKCFDNHRRFDRLFSYQPAAYPKGDISFSKFEQPSVRRHLRTTLSFFYPSIRYLLIFSICLEYV
jgi:hypothetical protein